MRVERSIEIAAPPEKIWPFLVEPEKILKWCITFKKFEYSGEQRSGVNTPFYIEERTPGGLMKLNFVFTEWVENERLAFSMTSGTGVKEHEQRWAVETIPSGSRFTFIVRVELPYGIIGKLIGLFARCRAEATAGKILGKLKSLAEA